MRHKRDYVLSNARIGNLCHNKEKNKRTLI